MSYSLFLAAALGIAAAGALARRRSRFLGEALILIGCLGCLACVGWQVRQNLFAPSSRGPDRAQAVVAYYLANDVLGEVGDRQGTIVVFLPPESVFDEETAGTYVGTFSRVLRGFPALKVQAQTLAVPDKAAKKGTIPLAAFQQVASNAPAALAYVSFAGVPADIEGFRAGDGQPGGGFFVFDPWGTTNWLSALRKGRVRSVIVPRPERPHVSGTEISGEPNEVFKQLYLRASPATADEIATALRGK